MFTRTAQRFAATALAAAVASALLLGGASAAMASGPSPSPAPAPAPQEGGINLRFDVPTSTPAPDSTTPDLGGASGNGDGGLGLGTGTGSDSGLGSGLGGGAGTGAGASDLPGSTAPVSTDPVTTADEVDLGGGLFLGGISTSYIPSVNPFAGEVDVRVGVRNASQSTIDVKADFWLGGPFGNRLGESGTVHADGLKPGEKRVVSAVVTGAGQWGIVNAHATVIPPKQIDGVDTKKMQRDAFVVVPPLYLLGLVVFGALGFAAWRISQWVTVSATEEQFA